MTNINNIVLESLSDHLKKHWKKYALGLGAAALAGTGGYKHYKDKKNKELELKNRSKLSFKGKQFLNNNKSKIKKGLLIGGGLIAAHQLYKSNKNGLLNSLKTHKKLNEFLDNHQAYLKKSIPNLTDLQNNSVVPEELKKNAEKMLIQTHINAMHSANTVLNKIKSNNGIFNNLIMKKKIKADEDKLNKMSLLNNND